MIAYQFEVGILDKHYGEGYDCVYDRKHTYYNENYGFEKDYISIKKYVENYIKTGGIDAYGIISKIKVTKEEYNSIYNGWSDYIDMDFSVKSVIYNAFQNKEGKLQENFIDLKTAIKYENNEIEEVDIEN